MKIVLKFAGDKDSLIIADKENLHYTLDTRAIFVSYKEDGKDYAMMIPLYQLKYFFVENED